MKRTKKVDLPHPKNLTPKFKKAKPSLLKKLWRKVNG